MTEKAQDDISLHELARTLISRKWLVAGTTAAFTMLAVAIALLMVPVYRGEVLLSPQSESSAASRLSAQFGGLASLAGVKLGDDSTEKTTAIAMLRSRAFIEEFVNSEGLARMLFDDLWDSRGNKWVVAHESEIPSMRKTVRRFREILFVNEDPQTGLVTVAVEWKDPQLAAAWANSIVQRLNAKMREGAIREAQQSIAYLQGELEKTNNIELQRVMYGLIEDEVKAIMLANARDEYAFRVLDPAVTPEPDERVRPHRTIMVIVGFMLGAAIGVFCALLLNAIKPTYREQR